MRRWYYTLICVILLIDVNAQGYLERQDKWVKENLSGMTLDQKIGQLFIIRAYSRGNLQENKLITDYIKKYHIGGLCFFQGNPATQAELTNQYQLQSKLPLFIAIDAEWGLGMRFPKETISYPKQMMLGAITDNKLIYHMGREIARQCKRIGVNINFAPSVDINSNPKNPVIYDRSFGESPLNVTSKGFMYAKGMEDGGIMACIKHFPGHGDTDIDSHYDLPTLNHKLERLEDIELYPFRRLAAQGISTLMVGHLHIPSLDSRSKIPATLSKKIIQELLREEFGYGGLIISDAMDMKAVTNKYSEGIAEAEAFLAGNDIILLPENLPQAFNALKSYINKGLISQERLDESVSRILRAKFKLGLNNTPQVNIRNVLSDLNAPSNHVIKHKLAQASVTLVSDERKIIPISTINDKNFTTVSLNSYEKTTFQHRVESYVSSRNYNLVRHQIESNPKDYIQTLQQFDYVLFAIHTSGKRNDFTAELSNSVIEFLREMDKKTNLIVVLFGSPYLLSKLEGLKHVIINYDNDTITQDVTAQSIFGVNDINGKLPVTGGKSWQVDHGLERDNIKRLGYAAPEYVGMNSDTLKLIDSLAREMESQGASPGGQVLIAKDGMIVFNKSYGKLNPTGTNVVPTTIYDVASLTKVLATTISVMKLVDNKKIDIYKPLSHYLKDARGTNKEEILLKDILAHHGRLLPWISFHEPLMVKNSKYSGLSGEYFKTSLKDNFTVPVAKNLYMRRDYIDSMYFKIFETRLRDNDTYRYSDLGFYLMQSVLEQVSRKPLNIYAHEEFYLPLGLKFTCYNPLDKFPETYIAPTELDNQLRKQVVRGHVHDMGAAMLGGVGGHAGLFSTSYEVAIIMQMLLNKGTYGGRKYIEPETIALFTQRHEKSSRRGLGFDMKELDGNKKANISKYCSKDTYGHTGFTGTAAWVDPTNQIVYVFLSNRTYPSASNKSFINKEYRIKAQDIMYRSLSMYSL